MADLVSALQPLRQLCWWAGSSLASAQLQAQGSLADTVIWDRGVAICTHGGSVLRLCAASINQAQVRQHITHETYQHKHHALAMMSRATSATEVFHNVQAA